MTIATTMPTISSATSNIRMRNTASPVFPVGESTRRQVTFSTTALKFFASNGRYCRGGPLWPPADHSWRVTGGHRGPPLQETPLLSQSRSVCSDRIDLSFGAFHDVGRQWRVLQ